jgi:ArsR family transcriptional regulator
LFPEWGEVSLVVDSAVDVGQSAGLVQLSSCLKTLCEENRMRILCFLMQGERSVCDLAACLYLPQNLVSHHLGVLRGLGLVAAHHDEHDARLIYYSVDRDALTRLNALYLSFFAAERAEPWLPCCGSEADCCLECLTTGSC